MEPNGVSLNGVSLNGVSLNGVSLNGISLNGISLNGISLNGISLNGISLNGISLNGISLNGTEFYGSQVIDGEVVERSGEDMVGLIFDLMIDVEVDGVLTPTEFSLRIDDMIEDPHAQDDDVFLYQLSLSMAGTDEWINPCGQKDGDEIYALPLQNYWNLANGDRIDDADAITWSCTTGVLTHCVEWGYRPWASGTLCDGDPPKGSWKKVQLWKKKHCHEIDLTDHHQACTRMARADYCGDGTPWTVAGTAIDIWDGLSPQIQERELHWKIEAEWTPDGAYCIDDIRQQQWKAEGMYPNCGKDFEKHNKKVKDCGSLDHNRALMVSSFYTPPPKKKKKKWGKW
ncbi:MAG: ADYC domain-containing protein [Nannocystaceae bacterium]